MELGSMMEKPTRRADLCQAHDMLVTLSDSGGLEEVGLLQLLGNDGAYAALGLIRAHMQAY